MSNTFKPGDRVKLSKYHTGVYVADCWNDPELCVVDEDEEGLCWTTIKSLELLKQGEEGVEP